MMTRLLLMVNKHRPDVDIHILRIPEVPDRLLSMAPECGVKCTIVDAKDVLPAGMRPFPVGSCKGFVPTGYDGFIPHLVYPHCRPAKPQHLLDGMREVLNQKLGLDVPLDWDCVAKPVDPLPDMESLKGYILMPSGGAESHSSRTKLWPEMPRLSKMLFNEGFNVAQIGSTKDEPLPGATIRLNEMPIPVLWSIFATCQYGVFLENGLAHWAGNCGMPHATLFISDTHSKPEHVGYPSCTRQVMAKSLKAETVYKIIRPCLSK